MPELANNAQSSYIKNFINFLANRGNQDLVEKLEKIQKEVQYSVFGS